MKAAFGRGKADGRSYLVLGAIFVVLALTLGLLMPGMSHAQGKSGKNGKGGKAGVQANQNGNPGAIWTTRADCGSEQQDVNHYTHGEVVFINGANFNPGTYSWTIEGLPGNASEDPGLVVESGSFTVGDSGSFCFAAYTVADDDGGEYKVTFGGKHDNYRIPRLQPTEVPPTEVPPTEVMPTATEVIPTATEVAATEVVRTPTEVEETVAVPTATEVEGTAVVPTATATGVVGGEVATRTRTSPSGGTLPTATTGGETAPTATGVVGGEVEIRTPTSVVGGEVEIRTPTSGTGGDVGGDDETGGDVGGTVPTPTSVVQGVGGTRTQPSLEGSPDTLPVTGSEGIAQLLQFVICVAIGLLGLGLIMRGVALSKQRQI